MSIFSTAAARRRRPATCAMLLGTAARCAGLSMLPWSDLRASAPPLAPRLFEADERLFGAANAEVIFWRDSAGWCPFCEMTWLVLEAMAVPYRVRTVPLRRYMLDGDQKNPAYTAMVGPDGVVPAVQFRTADFGRDLGYGPPIQSVERIFGELRSRYPSQFPSGDAAVRALVCEGDGSVFGRLRVARRSYEACAGAQCSELIALEPLASALADLDTLLEEADARRGRGRGSGGGSGGEGGGEGGGGEGVWGRGRGGWWAHTMHCRTAAALFLHAAEKQLFLLTTGEPPHCVDAICEPPSAVTTQRGICRLAPSRERPALIAVMRPVRP